jgi:hypothetical protein
MKPVYILSLPSSTLQNNDKKYSLITTQYTNSLSCLVYQEITTIMGKITALLITEKHNSKGGQSDIADL